jgi:predicted DNA-binding ribbon-helix-helix protein
MKSPIVKRSIVVSGRKTTISIEDPFWTGLKEIPDPAKSVLNVKVKENGPAGIAPL